MLSNVFGKLKSMVKKDSSPPPVIVCGGVRDAARSDRLKIVFVGSSTTGKSQIIGNYTNAVFVAEHIPTIGVEFASQMKQVNGDQVKLMIWDAAGQERFQTIATSYYRGGDAIVIVFDITNKASFDAIKARWWKTALAYSEPKACKVLVGNKLDKEDERQVDYATASELAAELGIPYVEVSAKTGANVSLIFDTVLESIYGVGCSTEILTKFAGKGTHSDASIQEYQRQEEIHELMKQQEEINGMMQQLQHMVQMQETINTMTCAK